MSAATYAHYVSAMSTALRGCATGAKRKQLYERAGAGLGSDLVRELFALRNRPQAEALRAVHDKLRELLNTLHGKRAERLAALMA
jgi:hypothetical protein